MDVFVAEVALGSMLIIETKLAGGVLAPRRSAFAAVRGGRRLHEALMPVEGNSCDRDVCVINSGSFGASPWPCPKKKKELSGLDHVRDAKVADGHESLACCGGPRRWSMMLFCLVPRVRTRHRRGRALLPSFSRRFAVITRTPKLRHS